jgi:hypothetical protein
MNFNFGEVLTRAGQITWKHKVLWIFGILAGCSQGGGGGSGNSGAGGSYGPNVSSFDLPPQIMQWLQTIEQNMTTFIAIGIAVICIVWILIIFLSTIGRIGLIRGTFKADGSEEKLIFGQLFSESMPYFWRMFALLLIVSLPILILLGTLVVGIAIFAISAIGGSEDSLIGIFAIMPLFLMCACLLVPIMFVLRMFFRQAENAVVLEDLAVLPSLSRGWEVFRANLGPIIIMAIILAILGFIVGLIIAIPVLLVVFPTIFALVLGQGETYTPLIFMGICLCIYIPVALVVQGIVTAYTESTWTLTYMRLTHKPETKNDPRPESGTPLIPEDSDKTIIARPNA